LAEIAIIGAGDLGAALAHRLAARGRIGAIRLIDAAAAVAAGKALDIQQAGPVEGFDTRLSADGDPMAAAGAAIIVLADRMAAGEWQGEPALVLLQRLAGVASDAILVCAGAMQRRLVEQGVREAKLDRRRLFGTAPAALAAAIRAIAALETGASPADVSVAVCGMPPHETVVGWSEAAAGGAALARTLSPPQLARLAARVPHLWPPGPYSLASAAAGACEALAGHSRRRCSGFVMLDGEAGARDVAVAMPLVLGPDGVRHVEMPSLSVQERVALGNAIEAARRG
jgi:malate dehydrogenase